jgi:hypothetical protein
LVKSLIGLNVKHLTLMDLLSENGVPPQHFLEV